MNINYNPIGYVHSPIKTIEGAPIQPVGADNITGFIELDHSLIDGLKDLDGFSHIIVLYHFHKSKEPQLLCKPFLDNIEHGIFAIRGPNRPNAIGFSIVSNIKIEENVIHIGNVDILDGTPVLDIKPYVHEFDALTNTKSGWLEKNAKRSKTIRSDDRFL
ncbi:MAG: putative tRNA (adenine(37)-N6)-methyltransferase [Candidatus Izimaplasma bacterium HR2]|nr:MAG: putative tRNA (adenine(37)-N6)-methyltransferase [Candidatus Izimaplasma bacterium HR2]